MQINSVDEQQRIRMIGQFHQNEKLRNPSMTKVILSAILARSCGASAVSDSVAARIARGRI